MTLPARKKRQKMGVRQPDVIRCPGHCKWVRQSFDCAIAGRHECVGVIEAHHVESRGSGGGDEQVVPLCSGAHSEGHTIGWETFARRYGVDLETMAADLWRASPHRIQYERKMKDYT